MAVSRVIGNDFIQESGTTSRVVGNEFVQEYVTAAGTVFIPIVGRGPGMALAGNGGGLAGNVYGGH